MTPSFLSKISSSLLISHPFTCKTTPDAVSDDGESCIKWCWNCFFMWLGCDQ